MYYREGFCDLTPDLFTSYQATLTWPSSRKWTTRGREIPSTRCWDWSRWRTSSRKSSSQRSWMNLMVTVSLHRHSCCFSTWYFCLDFQHLCPPPVVDRKVKRPLPQLEIPLEPRSAHEEFSLFKPPEGEPKIRTSPQLLLATHRFLSRGLWFLSVNIYLHGKIESWTSVTK